MRCLAAIGLILLTGNFLLAQDTFSIVAVDPETGEVGSAGASCLDDSVIADGVAVIGDLIPGVGAINTQSFYLRQNQLNANQRMRAGDSPQEIIDWLVQNDNANNPEVRQYGIAAFDDQGNPLTAAFTGQDCFDETTHLTGPNYAIQGNILISDTIVDAMERAFLAADGSLADKLMAALQGANIPGADSRCLDEGVSSQSAFLFVAKPDDPSFDYWLDLRVGSTPFGVEPIDSLQVLFDEFIISSVQPVGQTFDLTVRFNPADSQIFVGGAPSLFPIEAKLLDAQGREVGQFSFRESQHQTMHSGLGAGIYYLLLDTQQGKTTRKLVITH